MKEKESKWKITWHGKDYYGTYEYLISVTKGYLSKPFEKVGYNLRAGSLTG